MAATSNAPRQKPEAALIAGPKPADIQLGPEGNSLTPRHSLRTTTICPCAQLLTAEHGKLSSQACQNKDLPSILRTTAENAEPAVLPPGWKALHPGTTAQAVCVDHALNTSNVLPVADLTAKKPEATTFPCKSTRPETVGDTGYSHTDTDTTDKVCGQLRKAQKEQSMLTLPKRAQNSPHAAAVLCPRSENDPDGFGDTAAHSPNVDETRTEVWTREMKQVEDPSSSSAIIEAENSSTASMKPLKRSLMRKTGVCATVDQAKQTTGLDDLIKMNLQPTPMLEPCKAERVWQQLRVVIQGVVEDAFTAAVMSVQAGELEIAAESLEKTADYIRQFG